MHLPSVNNFDLIRLFAATEVMVLHAAIHMGLEGSLLKVFSLFPGVPIFFFISGFLIFASLDKSQSASNPLFDFFKKRILRLYPALIFCFVFSLGLVYASGYFSTVTAPLKDFGIWTFTSLTFFQFYNPEFLRNFGVGVLNGSLWTISVELQFYILMPLIYFLLKNTGKWALIAVVGFGVLNVLNVHANSNEMILQKLISVSFAPWLYMFLMGAVIANNGRLLEKILAWDWKLILPLYLAVWWASDQLSLGWGNHINPLGFMLLVVLVLKVAFSKVSLADRLLNRNDISYGLYIFHMPIINFLIYQGITGVTGVVVALICTTLIAVVSWVIIERPSLRLKGVKPQIGNSVNSSAAQ